MGNKGKKHGNRPSTEDLLGIAQRAMEKEDFKEALKTAKLCFRQDPAHEHRQMLERAWLARGLQLARLGLQTEGRAAAQELLDLGVSEPDVKSGLSELLMAVGLYDQAAASGRVASGEADSDPAFLAKAADRAVANPSRAPASIAGIREGAAAVRAALDSLYAGDEEAASAALHDVPRNSPFAEWKFFVRGLAAYYRQDAESMRANWQRLTPDRYAARLAASLQQLANPAADVADREEFRQAVRVLEKDILGGPVVWHLELIQKSLLGGRWREAIVGLRRWTKDFQATQPELTARLERLFYDTAVRKANLQWLNDLVAAIDPPRWDPRWNRARALIGEREDDGAGEIETHWLAYLEDLSAIPDLKLGELPMAQAMIWQRLGRRWAEDADEYEDEYDEEDYYDDYEDDEVEDEDAAGLEATHPERAKAIQCYERAIGLAPGNAEAYHALAEVHVEWEQDDAAAEVYRRLLSHVPNDLGGTTFLSIYHRKRDEGLAARDYALQALRLKPASAEIGVLVVAGRLTAARTLARDGRYDEARAELAEIEAAGRSPALTPYDLSIRRAIIDFKAGQDDAGRRLVDLALKESDDPADVYLSLSIEAVRYDAPIHFATQFKDLWQSNLKRRRSRAAGAMARRMVSFLIEYEAFAGSHAYLKEYWDRVLKYIGSGCARLAWQSGDLLCVCHFLQGAVENFEFRKIRKTLIKYLDVGRKKFSAEPEFHLMRGLLEMSRGPSYCDRPLARECFQMAIDTAKAGSHPKFEEIQEVAQDRLRLLGRTPEVMPRGRSEQPSDDFAGVPPTFFDDMGPNDMAEVIRRMAESMGFDGDSMLDKVLKGMPTGPGRHFAHGSAATAKGKK